MSFINFDTSLLKVDFSQQYLKLIFKFKLYLNISSVSLEQSLNLNLSLSYC